MTDTSAPADQMTEAVPAPLSVSGGDRIASLDFIRGIAVMGILAANIVGFGQPFTAYMYPAAFAVPNGDPDGWMWVAQFVLIDGKMRALFTLLFGAGVMLFMEKAWAHGATRWLQARRLLWLGAFGLCHFFLIWRGDILFLYAVAGLLALLFVSISVRDKLVMGGLGYLAGGIVYLAMIVPLQFITETPLGEQAAFAETRTELNHGMMADLADGVTETGIISAGDYAGFVVHNFVEHGADLPFLLFLFMFETLPAMLIGMALYQMGFFSGQMDRRTMRLWGWIGLLSGAALHLVIALPVQAGGFTYYGTLAAFSGWAHIPRLIMALGLAGLLVLYAPQASGWLGQRISAAGRAAFTNYLGTSVFMMLVFHGWAGGLFGSLSRPELYLVVVCAWIIMLLWSKPWLERFRYGPLEWLWRCLTYGKLFALRR